jgi:hypothetical protein
MKVMSDPQMSVDKKRGSSFAASRRLQWSVTMQLDGSAGGPAKRRAIRASPIADTKRASSSASVSRRRADRQKPVACS